MSNQSRQLNSVVLAIIFSILILSVFFFGALADRLFVIKPLDALAPRNNQSHNLVQDQKTNPLRQLLESGSQVSVADVAEEASKSVVTVSVKRQQQILRPGGFGFFGFGFGVPTGETEEVQQDIGTGFVVDSSGLVVTNKHVVTDSNVEYLVIDKDGVEYEVENIYRDPVNDLAILSISSENLPPLALGNSDEIRVGEPVIAIGTALGEFRHTVTTGVISGLGRGIQAQGMMGTETLENVIQTDAAINPGNSGGPLLSSTGEVIGVNVAVSAAAENIGFAIPINVVKASLDNFNQTGQFDRPFLGVRYQVISREAALANEVPQGAYLIEVVDGSLASEAGLQEGDILTKFNNEEINAENDLAKILNSLRIGQRVDLEYWRDGQRNQVQVTLRSAN